MQMAVYIDSKSISRRRYECDNLHESFAGERSQMSYRKRELEWHEYVADTADFSCIDSLCY